MVYRNPFVINMLFQSQYTYTFMLKVCTHVQFHSVSHNRVSTKTAPFCIRCYPVFLAVATQFFQPLLPSFFSCCYPVFSAVATQFPEHLAGFLIVCVKKCGLRPDKILDVKIKSKTRSLKYIYFLKSKFK